MILTNYKSNIPKEELIITYKTISQIMQDSNTLRVDNSFIRVNNFLANIVCNKFIDDENEG